LDTRSQDNGDSEAPSNPKIICDRYVVSFNGLRMFLNTGRFEASANSLASKGMIRTVFFHLEWSLSCLLRGLRSCFMMWKVVIWVRFWEKSEIAAPPAPVYSIKTRFFESAPPPPS